MIRDHLLVDATAHAYNWARENWALPIAESTTKAGFGQHQMLSAGPELFLSEEEFSRDWPVEDLADTLFFETGVDMIVYHGTPIFDFYKDGHSDTEKGLTLREMYPGRVMVYGAMDPFSDPAWRDQLDYFAERKVDGLKVYAARYEEGKTVEQRLDNPEAGYAFIERARDLGIRVIATHKAIPFGPVSSRPYGVDDMPEVLSLFPDMNFEVVHSGWAFVEDTAFLGFFENCWFNLEQSFSLIARHPRRFADFLGALMASGARDRIMWSSGMAVAHPRRHLERFMDFELPEDLLEFHGCPQLNEQDRRGILGENILRLHGRDSTEFRSSIARDDVSVRQKAGLDEPWTAVRSGMSQVQP